MLKRHFFGKIIRENAHHKMAESESQLRRCLRISWGGQACLPRPNVVRTYV